MEKKVRTEKKTHPLLDTFWSLTNESEVIRLRGLKKLLDIVTRSQNTYKHRRSQSSTETGKTDPNYKLLEPHLKSIKRHEPYCIELDYSLTRLIRGLASSEETTRSSFSSALTEV